MRIKLQKIKYENFKCFKSYEVKPNGNNTLIRGENGRGKTSAMDGFFWLHTDKDSSGRKAFKMRPLDGDSNPIKGLVVAVEDVLLTNGTPHTFKKEQYERVVKKQIKGFTNLYWIDGVPKSETEFKEYHDNLCPEDIFKMLTDLDFFNNDKKFPWEKRRKIWWDMVGKVAEPAGFEGLTGLLNGRTIAEYEKMLKGERKAHEKERDEINPRIDELQRGLTAYAQTKGDNETELQANRKSLQAKIAVLIGQRTELLADEKQRQEMTTQINQLTVKRLHRESIIKNQSGPLEVLIDERTKLEADHGDKTQELVILQGDKTQELVILQGVIQSDNITIDSTTNQISQAQVRISSIRGEYKNADSSSCSTCGQEWPAGRPKPGLADIEARGEKTKELINELQAVLLNLQDARAKRVKKSNTMVEELKTAEAAKNKRIAEINEAIAARPEPDPAQDSEWQGLTEQIEKLLARIGEPVVEQLTKIEAERGLQDELLKQMNECLAQADAIEKSKARIVELEAKEKELAQKIATIEGQLEEIDRYNAEQNKLIEAAVNGSFQHVEFKLFDYYLNEGYKPCCVALLDGIPYPDMSAGQKIYCAIDVINTLSDHYGVDVPLFIDHAESMTMPIEAESQVIRLIATFIYECVGCGKITHRQHHSLAADEIPQIVECEHCGANAKRVKELRIEVEQSKEAKAVA